jgi:hypothetical protein
VNQVPCALSPSQPANTIKLKGNKTPKNNKKVNVHTDGACSGTVTITFPAGNPGPASTVTMTVTAQPTGSGPFVYSASVPGSPTWSAGTVTATVRSGTTVLGTIQVVVS